MQEVGAWVKVQPGCREKASYFLEAAMTGEDLHSLAEDDDTALEDLGFKSKVLRSKFKKLLVDLVAADPGAVKIDQIPDPGSRRFDVGRDAFEVALMPPGKQFSFFSSHRKKHSRLAGLMEQLAMHVTDNMNAKGFSGFFDVVVITPTPAVVTMVSRVG